MKYNIICEECDTEYEIVDDDDLNIEPNYCPYCSEPIDDLPASATPPNQDDYELDS
tara:strand:- start:3677 stop:3844 length:168 start_codon:yes stop_codon:yes gene_type:complete